MHGRTTIAITYAAAGLLIVPWFATAAAVSDVASGRVFTTLTVVLAGLFGLAGALVLRAARRPADPELCPHCGYRAGPTRAISVLCPECGRPPEEGPTVRMARLGVAAAVLSFLVAVVLFLIVVLAGPIICSRAYWAV